MSARRVLHFVFKVGDRNNTAHFYRNILGMKFLRHEEFDKGCEAACNGPYDGKWSKSMVGFGPEDKHFVLELTYNYGIGTYKLGNDFLGITIFSKEAVTRAKKENWPLKEESDHFVAEAPGGYKFQLHDLEAEGDPIQKVTLASSNIERTIAYWKDLLGMRIYEQTEQTAILGYDDHQCKLEFRDVGGTVDHAAAFGRIAFSCPSEELAAIEAAAKAKNETILTPLVSLDTPGKATVQVVILADPDGHEICFVGDEAFRQLSKVDPGADTLLEQAMADDKSDEWFAKKGKSKGEA